ncbi:MAG: winged helix-turn-helix transcriptional regulator [Candidatus Thermoplasmatota archaeon]
MVAGLAGARPSTVQMEFLAPAQLESELRASNSTWLLIILDSSSIVEGNLAFGGPLTQSTFTEQHVTVPDPIFSGEAPFHASQPTDTKQATSLDAKLGLQSQVASIYIEAEHIVWAVSGIAGTIDRRDAQAPLANNVDPYMRDDRAARYDALHPSGAVVVWTNANADSPSFSVSTLNPTVVETSGIGFSCMQNSDFCPDGRDRSTQTPPNTKVETRTLSFHRFEGRSGQLNVSGRAQIVAGGSNVMDLELDGTARFPLAAFDCFECNGPELETLKVSGKIALDGLAASNQGRMDAEFRGNLVAAKIDERGINPELLLQNTSLVAATAAGAGLLFILKFLLAPFFTRLTKEQALEHPRRKQIFGYIQLHPGANFREVARNTGIAAGTVRHHLNVLERSGQVVEHPHGSTVRLFENHGKFDQNWSDLVLLREPVLGKLHDWLKAHPNSPQKAVLEAMEAENWSRSTTQHRLSRLVDGGVASIRLQGRLKMYSVVEKPTATTRLLAPPGAVSA